MTTNVNNEKEEEEEEEGGDTQRGRRSRNERDDGPLYLFLFVGSPLVLLNPTIRLIAFTKGINTLKPEMNTMLTRSTWIGSVVMMSATLWNMNAYRRIIHWWRGRRRSDPTSRRDERASRSSSKRRESSSSDRGDEDDVVPLLRSTTTKEMP